MNRLRKIKIILRFVLALSPFFLLLQAAYAQSSANNTQTHLSTLTSAVPFVGMSSDARNGGLGNTAVGSTHIDPNAVLWNVAKTARQEDKFAISINYNPLLTNLQIQNFYLLSFAATYKIGQEQSVSVFGKYFNIDKIDVTDEYGDVVSNPIKPINYMTGVAYARNINKHWSIGLGAKFIYSDIANGLSSSTISSSLKPALAFAGDIGLFYTKEVKSETYFSWGLSITNLGNKMKYSEDGRYDFLPANLGTGCGIYKIFNRRHAFRAGLDINKNLLPRRPADTSDAERKAYYNQNVAKSWLTAFSDRNKGLDEVFQEFIVNVGMEYLYRETFFIRGGHTYQNAQKGNGSMATLGLGLRMEKFDIDVCYGFPTQNAGTNNSNPLANSIRLSFAYKFAGGL